MFFADVVNRDTIPAMDAMLKFTQDRHRLLAENVANADTPGYRAQHLAPAKFQKALRAALDQQRQTHSSTLRIEGSDQFEQDENGRLIVKPRREPAENVLFHDQTNVRIERQMALLAENAMMHQTVAELLRGKYQGLLAAIRGRAV